MRSIDASGRLRNRSIRARSWRAAAANVAAISASDPSAAAGSGMPQCAVTGLPGQIGHTSPAALSQTVMMKSSGGAPGLANSSQDFDRRSSVGSFRVFSSWIA